MVALVLVLGDQLSLDLSALRAADKAADIVVMAEVAEEAGYARHHKKKLAFTFAAMRHFVDRLRTDGWQVAYGKIDAPDTAASIPAELLRRAEQTGAGRVITTRCGEWRLRRALDDCPLQIETLADARFIASEVEFTLWAEGRKSLRMEYFYREMRRKTGLLMEGDKPAGGKWNFDHDNRKAADRDLFMPQPLHHAPDATTAQVLEMVATRFNAHPGELDPFWLAVDAEGARASAEHFFEHALPGFGDTQDAMLEGEAFLHHSVLSTYLNAGLLDPLWLCRRAEEEYKAGCAPLNAVEGYIRQILGWREFVRGLYDREGPDYTRRNALEARRPLPAFYWDPAATDMACVQAAVTQTLTHAYAHHIQRLMVTGTFALLAGVDPFEVHEWYLAVYSDAYEWVEAPNVIGMSQFADGGLLASKPYAASGAYINKMSDHCRGCHYSVSAKSGETACPFNPLYWDFLIRNRAALATNPRMAQMYRVWDRMSDEKQAASRETAARILARLDAGERV